MEIVLPAGKPESEDIIQKAQKQSTPTTAEPKERAEAETNPQAGKAFNSKTVRSGSKVRGKMTVSFTQGVSRANINLWQ